MPLVAIRGATVAAENSPGAILAASRELLESIVQANDLTPDELVSIIYTLTPDLDAAYPTRAAREMGWTQVALLDAQQPSVQGDLARCLRVLIHCHRAVAGPVQHIYLREAKRLRPDLSAA